MTDPRTPTRQPRRTLTAASASSAGTDPGGPVSPTLVLPPPAASPPAIWTVKNGLQLAVACAIPIALLFGVSGRWDWIGAWVYLAMLLAGAAAAMVVFAKYQPALYDERTRRWREGKQWDRPFLAVVALGPVFVQLVCGWDARVGWSPAVSVVRQTIAGVAMAAGVAITAWAMAVNPFFSSVVRIQTDRGHHVVVAGPYRYVRHPGYAGMLLVTLAGPILLGTLWGLIPAAVVAGAFALRAALEDRTLRDELPGYTAYAASVRSRLLPGIW